jgi:tetratricopeptide (TPR) repeat protein
MAEIAYRQGLRWSQHYDAPQAYEKFNRAARLAPWRVLYRLQLAHTAMALAQMAPEPRRSALFSECWDQMRQLTSRYPKNAALWKEQGLAALWISQLSKFDHRRDAGESFHQAVMLDESDADAWTRWAQWNQSAGHSDEERQAWQHVIAIDPSNPMARQNLARVKS